MFEIDIQNEIAYRLTPERLKAAALATLERFEFHLDAALTIVITDDEAIQKLNRQHRGIDAPTDVLSFPADPLPMGIHIQQAHYLGDLVIAYPYAQAQAQGEGHDLMDSLCVLVVHGTLHLLGYDHATPEERAEMWAEQADILAHLGIDPRIVPALESYHDQDS